MKKRHTFNKHTMAIMLSGLLLAFLSMGVVVGAAGAITNAQSTSTPNPETKQTPTETRQSKECAECHPNIDDAWVASPHAHAYDDKEFVERWDTMGKPGECLSCHTTGYQSTTNTFTAEGIQCEACHGEAVENHPPAIVPVQADTDYCGSCHTTTLGEWRLTGHSTAGVGCMDCHDPHSQKALFEDPDEMCLNCHKEDMGAYLEDLHIQKGIGCTDCHALVIPPDPAPEDGIVPTGHSFTITTSTCVACHTDALHAGFSLPGYENGAHAANGESTESVATQPAELPMESLQEATEEGMTSAQRIQALEAALVNTRLSTLFQGGIIGLVLGGLTVYYLRRNTSVKVVDKDNEQAVDNVISPDGEVIDIQLEKALVQVERALDWSIVHIKPAGDWVKAKFTNLKKNRKANDGGSGKGTDDSSESKKGSGDG